MDIKQPPCLICDEPSIINHLFQPFQSCDFGKMIWQQFTLCPVCNDLLSDNHIALLTDRFIANEERNIEKSDLLVAMPIEVARALVHEPIYKADVYHLLTEFNHWRKAKLN